MLAAMGLEEDDLYRKEEDKDGVRDWLDDWIKNLEDDINPGRGDMTGGVMDMELEEQDDFQEGQPFMDWLIKEHKEMRVEDDIIGWLVDDQIIVNNPVDSQDRVNECVTSFLCPGDCCGQSELNICDGQLQLG